MKKSVVATRLIPVVKLLLLEIVDAEDLAEEVVRTLSHDPGISGGGRANGPRRRLSDSRTVRTTVSFRWLTARLSPFIEPGVTPLRALARREWRARGSSRQERPGQCRGKQARSSRHDAAAFSRQAQRAWSLARRARRAAQGRAACGFVRPGQSQSEPARRPRHERANAESSHPPLAAP